VRLMIILHHTFYIPHTSHEDGIALGCRPGAANDAWEGSRGGGGDLDGAAGEAAGGGAGAAGEGAAGEGGQERDGPPGPGAPPRGGGGDTSPAVHPTGGRIAGREVNPPLGEGQVVQVSGGAPAEARGVPEGGAVHGQPRVREAEHAGGGPGGRGQPFAVAHALGKCV